MSCKILVTELSHELLSTNQIAGFQKVQYLKNELRDQVGPMKSLLSVRLSLL